MELLPRSHRFHHYCTHSPCSNHLRRRGGGGWQGDYNSRQHTFFTHFWLLFWLLSFKCVVSEKKYTKDRFCKRRAYCRTGCRSGLIQLCCVLLFPIHNCQAFPVESDLIFPGPYVRKERKQSDSVAVVTLKSSCAVFSIKTSLSIRKSTRCSETVSVKIVFSPTIRFFTPHFDVLLSEEQTAYCRLDVLFRTAE